jgi:hypothetical protein
MMSSEPDEPEGSGLPGDGEEGTPQGLYVTLPAEELTLEGFAEGGRADTMAPGALLAMVLAAVAGMAAKGWPGWLMTSWSGSCLVPGGWNRTLPGRGWRRCEPHTALAGDTGPPGEVDGFGILDHIIRGPCAHAGAEDRYRPSRNLAHRVKARNATCTAPGCGRRAARCDLDHTSPHHVGGLTCECNLAPQCKR